MNLGKLSLGLAASLITLSSAGAAKADTISVAARLGYSAAVCESQSGKDVEGGVIPLQVDAMYHLPLGFRVGLYGSYGVLTGLPDGTDSGRQTRLGAQAQLKEMIEEKGDEVAKFIKGETTKLQIELKGGNLAPEMKAVADVSTANVTGGSVWGAI